MDVRRALLLAAALLLGAACTNSARRDFSPRDAGADSPDASVPLDRASADWRRQVIYLAFPDRFHNGDPANDEAGAPSCFAREDPLKFHGGDLAGLRQKLGYLRELGASAVWVTPLNKQIGLHYDACGYHGYWADLAVPDDGALEPKLGTEAELKGLLDDVHAADMRLVLDMVVNHAGYGAKITRQKPQWFHPRSSCGSLGDPEIFCPLSGLPDFAQEDAEVAGYLTDLSRRWVERFPIDGIRMDTAKHVPLTYFSGSWVPAVRQARPGQFLVAEVMHEGPLAEFGRYLDAGFDSAFNFPLRRALVEAFAKGGSVDLVASRVDEAIASLGLERALMLTSLLDNHDTPRFLSEAKEPLPADEALRRYTLALTALFTLPGIPQVFYGDELGMVGEYPENRRDMPDWAWQASTRAGERTGYLADSAEVFALTRKLIRIRGEHPALSDGYFSELWRQNGGKNLFAYYRGSGPSRVVVVLHNDAGSSGPLSLPWRANPGMTAEDRAAFPDGTVLVDLLGAGAPPTLRVESGELRVEATGKVAGIYVKQ